ncbi:MULTISPECIES: hypothetical protein [Francisella]|uniref:Uncharacterized protein n=1 Tax=Francisella opportunistica TaxID=2016517 RepID=A0A345JPY6_9GAMM|nr:MULTISPECIES: hypothetical protein [Francisella]APC91067.1 hypothetical protein BBG19_0329 [Francisella sp. MA067296]AXH29382.1 hypothetical protein CGC43_01660 [Francisella opportunistica]AXH31033.1 hypothetical protein CGC44_01640 [Francisella opportunistica]AXH32680.1 hypothetical protein CGC45_01640 [Francisella opportunistica]
MYEEQFLAEKLQQFTLVDIALVKIVYFLVGVLVATNYLVLTTVSWIFYLLMFLTAVFPIVIHLFSFEGSYIEKARMYIKTNKPSYQVLLFFSQFFFACMLVVLVPILIVVPWYVYAILIVVFAIKPMRSNMFW